MFVAYVVRIESVTEEFVMSSKKFGRFKVIAACEVAGGITGLVAIYISGDQFTTLHSLLISLFSLPIWAGLEMWRGKPRGLTLSIVCQSLQIPLLLGSAFSYKYLVGLHFVIGYFPGQGPISFGFISEAFIYINFVGIETGFGINLLALAFLVILLRTSEIVYKDYCREVGRRTSRENTEGDL